MTASTPLDLHPPSAGGLRQRAVCAALRRLLAVLLLALAAAGCAATGAGPAVAPLAVLAPPPQVPVILVPGMTGTELVRPGGDLEWGSGRRVFFPRDRGHGLALPLGVSPGSGVELRPGRVLREIRLLGVVRYPVYEPLVRAFEAHGYVAGSLADPRPGDTFLTFPYDWRRDHTRSARELLKGLQRLHAVRGGEPLEVDLVCQSSAAHLCRWLVKYGGASLEEAEGSLAATGGGNGNGAGGPLEPGAETGVAETGGGRGTAPPATGQPTGPSTGPPETEQGTGHRRPAAAGQGAEQGVGPPSAEPAPARGTGLPPEIRVRRVVLVGASNAGSLRTLMNLHLGRRYLGVGRHFSPETLFTFPALYQDLPVPGTFAFLDPSGAPVEVDLYDPASWLRYGWSAFHPAVAGRLAERRSGAGGASVGGASLGGASVAGRSGLFGTAGEREAFLARQLDRARRFQDLLARDVPLGGTGYLLVQNPYEPTVRRAVIDPTTAGPLTRFPYQEWFDDRPYLFALTTAPGDHHATLASQQALSPSEWASLAAEPFTVTGGHFEMIREPATLRWLTVHLAPSLAPPRSVD